MRNVTLDLAPFEEKISLHRYLKEALDFPFYYGANLDALHDELSPCISTCTIQNLRAEKWWITCPNCFAYLRTQRGKIIIWKSPIRKRRNASGF